MQKFQHTRRLTGDQLVKRSHCASSCSIETRAIGSERKSSAFSVYLWFSPTSPVFFLFFFLVFFFAPLTQFLEEGTPAREQVLISALAKSARPTRFESVIELREVCGEFVRVSSTKKISLSRTKSHCKGRNSVEKL